MCDNNYDNDDYSKYDTSNNMDNYFFDDTYEDINTDLDEVDIDYIDEDEFIEFDNEMEVLHASGVLRY